MSKGKIYEALLVISTAFLVIYLYGILKHGESKVIMSVVYIFILVPVATLYRLTKKDKLRLKRSPESNWINREHRYTADDLKNIW